MSGIIYVDLQCLQDPECGLSGISSYLANLLEARRRREWWANWKTLGIVDPARSTLLPQHLSLVDEIIHSANPCVTGATAIYINGAPMTHDLHYRLRFQSHPKYFRVAVVHDLPLPESIEHLALCDRIEYLARLAWLRKFDFYFSTSAYAATQLSELLAVPLDKIETAVPEAEDTADLFWNAIEERGEHRGGLAVISRHQRPRLAFLSPNPPETSEAACFYAMAAANRNRFDADVFAGALIGPTPLVGDYDAVVSILANDLPHARLRDVVERYGGPCIVNDARLTDIDFRRVSPFMVQSLTQQALVKQNYAIDAGVLTSCPTVLLEDQELTDAGREMARRRLGTPAETYLVACFDGISQQHRTETCILALEFLRSWNIPAVLYFAGAATPYRSELEGIAVQYNIAEFVHYSSRVASETAYRDLLAAADAGVQIRPYGFGKPTVPLSNCIASGLPTVANLDAAKSCDAPAYVHTVPDVSSPLLVAEQLALLWEAKTDRRCHAAERADYLQTHNFKYYGQRLIEVLGIA